MEYLDPVEQEVAQPDQELEVEQPEEEIEQPEVEQEVDDPEEPQLTRAQQRHQKLANERAEATARAEAAERERDFYRQQALQAQQVRQAPPQEEFLTPEEEWQRDAQAQMNQVMFTTANMQDQSAYLMKAATNPTYAKYAERVEAELAKARQAGSNPTREFLLKSLIGDDVLRNAGKQTPTQKKAAERTAAARGAPPANKPTVPAARAGKGDSLEDLERRLQGVRL